MTEQFENAKKVLELLLNREWNSRDSAPEEYRQQLRKLYPEKSSERIDRVFASREPYFLRRSIPEIVARGTHQIIIKLGDNYVGKTRAQGETSCHYVLHTSLFYEPSLDETLKLLEELGFAVPEHHYVGVQNQNGDIRVKEKGFAFVIAHDLTENGIYKVEDVRNEHFERLANGAELKEQLTDALGRLLDIHNKKRLPYIMIINDHVTTEGPQEAIRH